MERFRETRKKKKPFPTEDTVAVIHSDYRCFTTVWHIYPFVRRLRERVDEAEHHFLCWCVHMHASQYVSACYHHQKILILFLLPEPSSGPPMCCPTGTWPGTPHWTVRVQSSSQSGSLPVNYGPYLVAVVSERFGNKRHLWDLDTTDSVPEIWQKNREYSKNINQNWNLTFRIEVQL